MARLSTGQTYGDTSRASAAQLLGGIPVASTSGAIAQGAINAPALQPRATPVETYQQTGAPILGGAPKFFAPPDLANPGQDLANLSKALGGFSATLQNFGETWLANRKERDKELEAASTAFVGQASKFGPARAIGDLAANLEKAIALGGPNAVEAAKYLQIVREKQNNSVGRYWLERSLEQNAISGAAMSLSDKLAATGTIKIDGKDVELNSLSSDDPRYRAHRDQLLFGGMQMSPQGYVKNQALIMQAQLQADEAQRKRYNSAQEIQTTGQLTANRQSIAGSYLEVHAKAGPADSIPYAAKALQQQIDSVKLLGLPVETQTKLINGYLEGFASDVVSAAKAKGFQITDMNVVLRPALRSVMTGPIDQRTKADGSPNEALRLYNTLGGEAYLDQVVAKANAAQIQDNGQRAQMAGIQAQQAMDARLQAALPEGRRSNPAAIKSFLQAERDRAAMEPDGIKRAALTSQINALDSQLTETYIKPVQEARALWYAQQLGQTYNNETKRNQLAAALQADLSSGAITGTAATSIQTTLSAQGSKEVRSYDKDINDRIDKMSKQWESYSKSPGSYGGQTIDGFESTALYKFRDQARRQSHDVVYKAIKDGTDPAAALNQLWNNNNWGLQQREAAASTTNTPYTDGTDWVRKNTQNWNRRGVDPVAAKRLRDEAKSKPIYDVNAWAKDVDALLNGSPSQNFKLLMKTLTTGSGGQKPSEVILNQFRLHGVPVDDQTRQRIEALDGQKLSMAPARRRSTPQQNPALNGIQIASRALSDLLVPPASASEMPMPPAVVGPPAILNQRTTGQGVLTPNARKWANAIASQGFEGASYNTKFGGGKFDNSKPHPGDGPAGRYQFQLATWKEINGGKNLPMTQANQDRAFVKLALRRGVDVNTADPNDFQSVVKLAPEWASLPTHRTRKQGYYEGQVRSTYRDFLKAWK